MKTEGAPTSQNNSGWLLRFYWTIWKSNHPWLWSHNCRKNGNIIFYGSIYPALLASLIIARYVDVMYFNGYKSDDSGPATMDDFRKYAAITLAACIFVLLSAISINSQLMKGVLL